MQILTTKEKTNAMDNDLLKLIGSDSGTHNSPEVWSVYMTAAGPVAKSSFAGANLGKATYTVAHAKKHSAGIIRWFKK